MRVWILGVQTMPKMTEAQFTERQAQLLKDIPEDFHGALTHLAWEQGHSYGYEEVLGDLENLVTHLREPILRYGQRMYG
jgi:hypothetical protein